MSLGTNSWRSSAAPGTYEAQVVRIAIQTEMRGNSVHVPGIVECFRLSRGDTQVKGV